MRGAAIRAARDTRGVAGMEFGLIAPVLILILGALTDFGLAFWHKGLLANSVAEGASYAVLTGPAVTPAAIRSIVGGKLSLPASSVTITGPAYYCVSGTPAAATHQTDATPCSSDGTTPGRYVKITAQYTYSPIFPTYSRMTSPVLTQTAMARLK